MMHFNRKKTLSFIFMFFFSIFLTLLATKIDKVVPMPTLIINKEKSALNFKTDFLRLTTFGHSRLVSSLLWITTMIEGDIDHYRGGDNSWMYYRFLSISKLEPLFYQNYLYGGQYLAIVKDDIYGADRLYKLGTNAYPGDFWLNYHAGFNAAFEIRDQRLALQYYSQIYEAVTKSRKYPFILSIINKLKMNENNLSLTDIYESFLVLIDSTREDIFKKSIETYLYAIKAEIDLNCLNSGNPACDTHDYNNNAYIRGSDNEWKAKAKWKPFRLKNAPSDKRGY